MDDIAALILDRIWINLYATGVGVFAYSAQGREESYETTGEVRTYAGGRRRAVTSAGEIGKYKFTLRLVARADVETIRNWAGATVQVRDNKGRRFFGTYLIVTISERVGDSTFDVALELTVVTAAEGVT